MRSLWSGKCWNVQSHSPWGALQSVSTFPLSNFQAPLSLQWGPPSVGSPPLMNNTPSVRRAGVPEGCFLLLPLRPLSSIAFTCPYPFHRILGRKKTT